MEVIGGEGTKARDVGYCVQLRWCCEVHMLLTHLKKSLEVASAKEKTRLRKRSAETTRPRQRLWLVVGGCAWFGQAQHLTPGPLSTACPAYWTERSGCVCSPFLPHSCCGRKAATAASRLQWAKQELRSTVMAFRVSTVHASVRLCFSWPAGDIQAPT